MTDRQTMDSLLATLVGMGFDMDRCQAALNYGKLTVHEAVEWILQDHNIGATTLPTHSAPTLSLDHRSQVRSDTPAAHLPFSQPPVPVPERATPTSPPHGSADPSETAADSRLRQQDVVSRFSLSDRKREEKERWEKEQRERAAVEARESRLSAKKERNNLLRNIEADKEARQLNMKGRQATSPTHRLKPDVPGQGSPCTSPPSTSPPGASPPGTSPPGTSQPGTSPPPLEASSQTAVPQQTAESVQSATPTLCTLQIRLPTGQSRRDKFSSSSNLQCVIDYIKAQYMDGKDIELIQPFPHRVYANSDMVMSLEDLKLTPNGCLVVKLATQSTSPQKDTTANSHPTPVPEQPPLNNSPDVLIPNLPPIVADHPQQRGGNADGREELMEVGVADGGQVDNADDMMGGVDEAGVRERDVEERLREHLRAGANGPLGLLAGRGRYDWGGGNRLQDGQRPLNFEYGFVANREQGAGRVGPGPSPGPSPQRAAEAALSRLAASALQAPVATPPTSDKPVTPLQALCLTCVSRRIEGGSTHHQAPVTWLEALPPSVADRLVEELKQSGTLRPKTLNLFLPCHLQQLSLDCYKYTTNELVQAVWLHVHINRLQLSACPLLTDHAFFSISSRRKLQYLNVSNNKQLTDKMLYAIKDLSNLVTLILDDTSVTNDGIILLSTSPVNQLANLGLNRTSVSDEVLPFLAAFPNLQSLSMEKTKIFTLEAVESLASLRSLNIARNTLMTSGLKRLGHLSDLGAVNVMHLEGIPGDDVLHLLQGLELKHLQLPDRHTTSDKGLCYIAGMPLVVLDLSDYINITDGGIHHIADMTSLTKLSLNNTKVTDLAMTYIQGLVNLKELHLDRTAITNAGAAVIGCFPRLEVLSMSSTQIKDNFLQSGVLSKCTCLTSLNLSKTDVTNRGIQTLDLPCLSLLNLDATRVTVNGANRLPGCPNVKVVRTNNLRYNRGDEQDDDISVQ